MDADSSSSTIHPNKEQEKVQIDLAGIDLGIGQAFQSVSKWLFEEGLNTKPGEENSNPGKGNAQSLLPELEQLLGGARITELEADQEELKAENEALKQQVRSLQVLAAQLTGGEVPPPPAPRSGSRAVQAASDPAGSGPALPTPSSSMLPVVQLAELEALSSQVVQLQKNLDAMKSENDTLKLELEDRKEESSSWHTQYSIIVQKYQEAASTLEELQSKTPAPIKEDKPQQNEESSDEGVGMVMDVVEETDQAPDFIIDPAPPVPKSLPPEEEQVLREKLRELEQMLLQSGEKANQLQETLENERDLHGNTAHGLQTEITELQTILDGLQGQRESMGAVIGQTQSALNEMTSKYEDLEKEHEQVTKELAATVLEREQLKATVERLQSELAGQSSGLKETQEAVSQMKLVEASLRQKLETTEALLQQKEVDSKAALRSSNQLVKQLQAELKKTTKDLNDLRTTVKLRMGDAETVANAVGSSLINNDPDLQDNFPTEGEDDMVFVEGARGSQKGHVSTGSFGGFSTEGEEDDNEGKGKDSKHQDEPNFFQKLFNKGSQENMVKPPVTESGKVKM
mmetsp:Transcript_11143/g.14472  ORF Transcript_11143/g.14472 Transcript_11143/m.14472 type:complete len:572 (+) Transcript_11143:281-1996(+)